MQIIFKAEMWGINTIKTINFIVLMIFELREKTMLNKMLIM
jgi:hypothetical protein